MSEAGEAWERDMWPIKIWEAKVIQKAQNWAKKKIKNYTSLLWDKVLKWKRLKPILPL